MLASLTGRCIARNISASRYGLTAETEEDTNGIASYDEWIADYTVFLEDACDHLKSFRASFQRTRNSRLAIHRLPIISSAASLIIQPSRR